MAKYKVITEFDQTQSKGRVFNWRKIKTSPKGQEQMKEAYDLGLTSYIEKIEDVKPEVKKVVVKKDKKDDLESL